MPRDLFGREPWQYGYRNYGILPTPNYPEMQFGAWYRQFAATWQQGEHAAIIGQTGSGKTTLASKILSIREWVAVLAIKRFDSTINQFKRGQYGAYKILKKWPPNYDIRRAVIWLKPAHLHDVAAQRQSVYEMLDSIFIEGGWCLLVDDTGYVTGTLKLSAPLAVLLNQGRSSAISVVSVMTQPSSVAARIPSESLRQVRHILAFRYRNKKDIEAISLITGFDKREIDDMMGYLGPHDFIAFSHGDAVIVRNVQD